MREAVMAGEMEEIEFGKGPDCPEIGELETLLDGAGSARLKDHTAHCPYCQTELALLREFTEGQPASAEEAAAVARIEQQLRRNAPWKQNTASAGAPSWWPAWLNWQSAGLAAALAAVLLTFALRGPQQPPVAPVEGGVTDTLRAGVVAGVAPVGDLEAAPALLQWQPVGGAARYRVRLLDVEQLTVWETSAAKNEAALPAAARALMLPRKTLFWQIEALDAQGKPLAVSQQERFRVVGRER
ncbi:MAG: hypothetical protein IT162_07755 [Bryobacterales bacterium]|nr:hypothetical protein [Bryobacterales bacterium]